MSVIVNSNLASLHTQKALGQNSLKLAGTFERLSSGARINHAADDAAGLGVSETMDADLRGMRQALRNANDGLSAIQIAEGATAEVSNIIKRMRELAVQSASETLADDERSFIQTEFVQLSDEVDRVAETAEFNGIKLTQTSSNRNLSIQVGTSDSANDRITVTFQDLRAASLGVEDDPFVLSLGDAASAQTAIDAFDKALNGLNEARAHYGAMSNRIEAASRNLTVSVEQLTSAKSRIVDADIAFETAQLASQQIIQQSGVAVLGQANGINQAAVRLLG